MDLYTVTKHCPCGKTWDGPAFKPAPNPREALCRACLEREEAAINALKHPVLEVIHAPVQVERVNDD